MVRLCIIITKFVNNLLYIQPSRMFTHPKNTETRNSDGFFYDLTEPAAISRPASLGQNLEF